jgi:hypothetical protein
MKTIKNFIFWRRYEKYFNDKIFVCLIYYISFYEFSLNNNGINKDLIYTFQNMDKSFSIKISFNLKKI